MLLSRESDGGASLWTNLYLLRSDAVFKFSDDGFKTCQIISCLLQFHQVEISIVRRLIQDALTWQELGLNQDLVSIHSATLPPFPGMQQRKRLVRAWNQQSIVHQLTSLGAWRNADLWTNENHSMHVNESYLVQMDKFWDSKFLVVVRFGKVQGFLIQSTGVSEISYQNHK